MMRQGAKLMNTHRYDLSRVMPQKASLTIVNQEPDCGKTPDTDPGANQGE
jgi:hypothetical protein